MSSQRFAGSVTVMTSTSLLQQQLDEVRDALRRARELFGDNPIAPPTNIAPDPDLVKKWVI